MTPKRELLNSDLLVRFNPDTRSISFHGINPASGKPLATAIHEIDWPRDATFAELIDVGAAACAHLFAAFPDESL
jgi:hypothetical protein